ncbi:hypothetical protein ACMD2_25918 [Ananas comosus]|uniref:Uncharacterized protein n=1 Tax=Ananas comosus TaxID=4615 RepID=A0A199V5W8_ANACO|nr:hypothetical protein ACMD2_25918 [Ananas comosus]
MPFYVLDKNGIVAITDGALQNAARLLNMDSIGMAMPQRKPWTPEYIVGTRGYAAPEYIATVIRELDCMKRHENFFRRPSSKASSALQWIEEWQRPLRISSQCHPLSLPHRTSNLSLHHQHHKLPPTSLSL